MVKARRIALKYVIAKFGNHAIQNITKQDYQAFIDEISKQFSRNYVSSIHTSANMVFKYAQSINLIKNIPTEKIKIPKIRRTIQDIENEKIQDNFFERDELGVFLLMVKERGLDGDLLTFYTTSLYWFACR